ncbi:PAS domain-containing protein [Variovorax sp. J22P168]|uniref:PAS domain-containing protein n=1 Tax=Variovorax jilinensis TaxID=3053513 RepID=UPI0025751A84|nr:PAS domain-containing protein [Variovorax sp. J22P168]MDM0015251.1 PAS domain-containing protein [Variovorax sp. J22P168]
MVARVRTRAKAKAESSGGTDADFGELIHGLPALVWTAGPDGRIDFLNQHWVEYTGLSADAGIGTGWEATIHPDDRPSLLGRLSASIGAGTACDAQARVRRFDGAFRWFQFRASPRVSRSGKIVKWFGITTDIDDLKRSGDAAAQSEQDLVDRIPASITVASATGEHIYTSSWGVTRPIAPPSVLRGLGFMSQLHSDEQDWVNAEWLRCVRTGETMELEHRLQRADGTYRWLHVRVAPYRDDSGAIVRWYGLISDIDDQRKAEEALRRSEQGFRLLVEMIPALVARWTPDGQLDYVNRRLLDYFSAPSLEAGLSASTDSFRRQRLRIASVHPEDWDSWLRKRIRSLETGEPLESTHRVRRADGTYRWFHERVEPMRDESGKISGWYAVGIDIHDGRVLEDALRAARHRLDVATQMAAIAELSASIAHEVNQPLTSVITNATMGLEMLDAVPPNVKGARETARRTVRDGTRAADVLLRLRALFMKEKDTGTELVDLNDAARDVVALSRGELQRTGAIVQTLFSYDLSLVRGDRVQFQQVILNLVRNAAQAMEGVHDRPRRLTITTERQDDNFVYLSVQDAGTGIAPQSIEKIFEAFYTTKNSGMGIGLSVSRSIIEKHGGRLWAEANQGPGSTFLIALPAGPKASDAG